LLLRWLPTARFQGVTATDETYPDEQLFEARVEATGTCVSHRMRRWTAEKDGEVGEVRKFRNAFKSDFL
jgi:hypothetical protein